jgi:two-component system, NarL family, response regulator
MAKEKYVSKAATLRILIADDHPVVREGLAAIFNHRDDMTVVAQASNGREAVEQYFKHLPDVALLDLRMPEMSGVEAIVEIRKRHPAARLVVLTTFDRDEDIFRALQAGAKAYFLKDAPREDLVACVRSVHCGKTVIPPAIAAKLAEHMSTDTLTSRELEVLRVMAEGKSNKEIASALGISEGTVKSHVNAIMRKLDASDRTQAVTVALKHGLLQLD